MQLHVVEVLECFGHGDDVNDAILLEAIVLWDFDDVGVDVRTPVEVDG